MSRGPTTAEARLALKIANKTIKLAGNVQDSDNAIQYDSEAFNKKIFQEKLIFPPTPERYSDASVAFLLFLYSGYIPYGKSIADVMTTFAGTAVVPCNPTQRMFSLAIPIEFNGNNGIKKLTDDDFQRGLKEVYDRFETGEFSLPLPEKPEASTSASLANDSIISTFLHGGDKVEGNPPHVATVTGERLNPIKTLISGSPSKYTIMNSERTISTKEDIRNYFQDLINLLRLTDNTKEKPEAIELKFFSESTYDTQLDLSRQIRAELTYYFMFLMRLMCRQPRVVNGYIINTMYTALSAIASPKQPTLVLIPSGDAIEKLSGSLANRLKWSLDILTCIIRIYTLKRDDSAETQLTMGKRGFRAICNSTCLQALKHTGLTLMYIVYRIHKVTSLDIIDIIMAFHCEAHRLTLLRIADLYFENCCDPGDPNITYKAPDGDNGGYNAAFPWVRSYQECLEYASQNGNRCLTYRMAAVLQSIDPKVGGIMKLTSITNYKPTNEDETMIDAVRAKLGYAGKNTEPSDFNAFLDAAKIQIQEEGDQHLA